MTSNLIKIDELKVRIADCHCGVVAHGKMMLESARDAGRHLLSVKQSLAHGEYENWVEKNCPFGLRTARIYQQINSRWDKIESHTGEIDSIRDALAITENPKRQTAAVLPSDFNTLHALIIQERDEFTDSVIARFDLCTTPEERDKVLSETLGLIADIKVNEIRGLMLSTLTDIWKPLLS